MKTVHDLTNEELESCIDGTTDLDMIRTILSKEYVVDDDGIVDVFEFADEFAALLENFITEDKDTAEWEEAWDTNFSWGCDIAHSINDLIQE